MGFRIGVVAKVHFRQLLARVGESVEVGCHRDARQRLGKVVRDALAVGGCMEDTVDVFEDRILRDPIIAVVLLEIAQGRISNVVDALHFGRNESGVVKDTHVAADRPSGGSTVRIRGSGGRASGR